MRRVVVGLVGCAWLAGLAAASPAHAVACSDDYVSVETVVGKVLSIDPAPDPFKSADIFIKGPKPCTRLWMQALKAEVVNCRVGDRIEARGVVTSDPDNHAWQINPERNEYMLWGADYTCTR